MMTLELSEEELQILVGLMDAGIRATGLRSIKDAAKLLEKLEAAQPVEPDEQPETEEPE